MSVLGLVVSFPLLVVSVALSAVPVWFAAKVVGAGRQEFWRVTLALVLAVVLAAVLMVVAGWKGLLLWPVVFVVVFSKMLEVSYLGAFLLCILAAAFQVGIAKLFGAMLGTGG